MPYPGTFAWTTLLADLPNLKQYFTVLYDESTNHATP